MKIEIDQSGKIENTSKDTVVAFSNGISASILMRAADKREIQKIFREAGKSQIFIYKLFAIMIFLLVKPHLNKISEIIIDNEYPGKSGVVKDFLMRKVKKINPKFHRENISFGNIGKKSGAHQTAYKVFKGKNKTDKILSVNEALKNLL